MKYLKKIDELQFIFFLAAGLVFLMTFISFVSLPSLPPSEVKITNITDSSLAISWVTDEPTRGGVVLSTQPNRILRSLEFFLCEYFSFDCLTFLDKIDKPSDNCYVFLNNLQPESSYYYRIVSGGRFWKNDKEGGILPSLKTTTVLEELSLPNPVFSWVLQGDGQSVVSGALVFLSLIGGEERSVVKSQSLSTFTDSDGIWQVDLGNLRSLESNESISPLPGDLLLIEVWAPDGRKFAEFAEIGQEIDIEPIILK